MEVDLGLRLVLQVVAVVALVFGLLVLRLISLRLLADDLFEHLHGLTAVLGSRFLLCFFDELGLRLLAHDYGLLELGFVLDVGLLLLLRDLSSDSEVVWFVYLFEDLLFLLEKFWFLMASFALVLVCSQVLGAAREDEALIVTICE